MAEFIICSNDHKGLFFFFYLPEKIAPLCNNLPFVFSRCEPIAQFPLGILMSISGRTRAIFKLTETNI